MMENIGDKFSRYAHALYDFLNYYLSFSLGLLFSLGLVISHNLVDYACLSILITFYTNRVKGEQNQELQKHLAEAAMLVSFQEGLTSFSAVVLAHISDAHVGPFAAIVFSTGAYVTGLTLFWSYARCGTQAMDVPIFLLATCLISLGKGGRDPLLQSFLGDQLLRENQERNQTEITKNIWLRSAWISGATIAIFGFLGAEWVQVFRISIIAMVASGFWFCLGFFWFKNRGPTTSHLSPILKVLKVALCKFRWNYPNSAARFYWNNSSQRHFHNNGDDQIMLLPRVPFIFKWVDKAAMIESPSSSTPEQLKQMGKLCSVKQVRKVKVLLTLTYIWVIFIPYSIVLATGNTFFPEQGGKMRSLFINQKENVVRFSLFFIIKAFVRDIVIFIVWLSGAKKLGFTLVRIGAGMLCAVISCIVAWKVEVERDHLVNDENIVNTSILWLCPHYVLFGLVEGLAQSGLEKLFENHQVESLRNLGRPFRDLASCTGKFLSIPLILIFRSWFKNFEKDESHLERYYLVLVGMSSVSLAIYPFVAYNYAKHVRLESEEVQDIR